MLEDDIEALYQSELRRVTRRHFFRDCGLGLGGRCSETFPQLLDSFVAVGQLGGLLFLLSLGQLQPLLRPISFGAQPIRVTAQGIFYLLRCDR